MNTYVQAIEGQRLLDGLAAQLQEERFRFDVELRRRQAADLSIQQLKETEQEYMTLRKLANRSCTHCRGLITSQENASKSSFASPRSARRASPRTRSATPPVHRRTPGKGSPSSSPVKRPHKTQKEFVVKAAPGPMVQGTPADPHLTSRASVKGDLVPRKEMEAVLARSVLCPV